MKFGTFERIRSARDENEWGSHHERQDSKRQKKDKRKSHEGSEEVMEYIKPSRVNRRNTNKFR